MNADCRKIGWTRIVPEAADFARTFVSIKPICLIILYSELQAKLGIQMNYRIKLILTIYNTILFCTLILSKVKNDIK